MDVGLLGAILLVTQLVVDGSSRVTVIGIVCTCFSLSMYGSPLAAMVSSSHIYFISSGFLIKTKFLPWL